MGGKGMAFPVSYTHLDVYKRQWHFLQKNDFDIYDPETTPFLPVPAAVARERNQVDALCKLMSEFIISQKKVQLPAPDIIAHAAAEKVRAELKAEEQEKELSLIHI